MKTLKMKTFKVNPGHGMNAGQKMLVRWPNKSYWWRFVHFITFRKPPMSGRIVEVMAVSPTSIKVREIPNE